MYRSRNPTTTPSFSSTLLDKIYDSIDESKHEEAVEERGKMRKKQIHEACRIENWMNHTVSDKISLRRRHSLPELERKVDYDSSSDSSSGGYSALETASDFGVLRPKPIRTTTSSARSGKTESRMYTFDDYNHQFNFVSYQAQNQNPNHEKDFLNSKSRALKMYANLKKVKQPISPGGKLASFLNSLFKTGNAKKSKVSSASIGGFDDACFERNSKSTQTSSSTCSSASSFSRSCLSKKSPSRRRSSNAAKRTVRFYPVSVIFDEDCRPCGQKCLYDEDHPSTVSTRFGRTKEERRSQVSENYRNQLKIDSIADVEDDDDDSASCSSSDLFELDHLRYSEELPVYETTSYGNNRAIAKGLIM